MIIESINKLKKIGLFVLLLYIFLLSNLFYEIPLIFLKIDTNSLNTNIKTLLDIFSSFVIIIILMIIYRKYIKEKWLDYKKNFIKYFRSNFKYWYVGLIGMAACNILIAILSPVKEANNEVIVQEMLKLSPILNFIRASILAPIIEEMLFRKSLGDIFKNKTVKVIMSGLIFGLLHVVFSYQTPYDLLYVFPYGILGGAFAYMLAKEDNIFIPITFHMLHNGIITLISILPWVLK